MEEKMKMAELQVLLKVHSFILGFLYGYTSVLHGPSMFAIKAKVYKVLYNPSSSIAFDEISSYWSVPKRS